MLLKKLVTGTHGSSGISQLPENLGLIDHPTPWKHEKLKKSTLMMSRGTGRGVLVHEEKASGSDGIPGEDLK